MKQEMNLKEKILDCIYRLQGWVFSLLLRALGMTNWLFRGRGACEIGNSRGGTSISLDGRYLISWSWKGLIYLTELFGPHPPIVTAFVVHPRPWGAHFSKDMQQIVITHDFASRTILSMKPGEGFYRRKYPIIQDWLSQSLNRPPRDIVEFIANTSSAYWKYENDSVDDIRLRSTNAFPGKAGELDCDWEAWVAHGDRFLDLPHETCELDG